ncbi:MAG: glycosyltransferase [Acidimicrobiales bacterium]|nr:glycosyltransferase [Acidimicrobiales bacterium]
MSRVALVAAKDAAGSIAATVVALTGLRGVDEVWVVDDGSTDATAANAAAAGARVVRLDENIGKGGALAVGLTATGHAASYLLADADLGTTAEGLQPLIDAHSASGATLVVGALPSPGGRGGFGAVKRCAAAGIRRACGLSLDAPLSGQRAVDGEALRRLELAPRFGVEVGMTIDLVRGGGTVEEVPVQVEHRYTGRSLAGFRHRARQGRDIAGALAPRLLSTRQRVGGVIATGVAAMAVLSLLSVATAAPRGTALPRADRVVLFAFDHLGLADLERSELSGLRGLVAEGAVGALSVRTTDRRSLDRRAGPERPSAADAYASLGASARVRSGDGLASAALTDAGVTLSAMQAMRALAKDDRASSLPGALGDRLRESGRRTAFVGGAQLVTGTRAGFPGAAALADRRGRIDGVDIAPSLLESTLDRPGVRASIPAFVLAVARSARDNDVVLVDPGETARVFGAGADRADRAAALRRTDAILAGVRGALAPRTTLIVFAPTPPETDWELTPVIVYSGTGDHQSIASPSTRRAGLGALTDLAPTVLAVLGVDGAPGMTGSALRTAAGSFDRAEYGAVSDHGAARSRFFLGASVGYTVAALAFYLLLLAALAVGLVEHWRRPLRVGAMVAACFPVALLLTGALQHWTSRGGESPVVLIGVCLGLGVVLSRWRGLVPVTVLAAVAVGAIAVDVATTGPLHTASLLGYSLQTTGRFYGLPNASFAVFAASLLLVASAAAGNVRPATPVRAVAGASVLAVGAFFVAAPWLGNDVGGTVALVPVSAALLWKFGGRRLTRRVVGVGAVVVAGLLAVVLGLEIVLGEGTHLGRLVGGGEASVLSTLAQRTENNLGLLVDQWWGFLVLAIAGAALVAVAQGRFARELPVDSPVRATVAATMVLSVLAFAVNDSGPVVAVLCLVVAAPVVALRVIDAPHHRRFGK